MVQINRVNVEAGELEYRTMCHYKEGRRHHSEVSELSMKDRGKEGAMSNTNNRCEVHEILQTLPTLRIRKLQGKCGRIV